MRPQLHFLVLGLSLIVLSSASKNSDEFERRQRKIASLVLDLLKTNETFAEEYRQWISIQREAKSDKEFPCPILLPSPQVPTSVHKLRPADVKIIGAIGDSLSAGRAVELGVLGLFTDFRGLSWSIGGDDEYSKFGSLPNILRLYNKDIRGYSKGKGNSKRHFNAAISGSTSIETLDQAKWLVSQMKESKDIDFEKDWKVVTFFIGGNDLCDFCRDPLAYKVEAYKKNVQEALDYLHKNLPRTFVNLVNVLHAEVVKDLNNNLVCVIAHWYACECAAFPNQGAEKTVLALREGYHKALKDLGTSGRYDTRDDFTVVYQPFYEQTYPPKKENGMYDMSYFAADCFHYSAKGQEASAKALWNNMIEPVGAKRTMWYPEEPIECPTEKFPYFFTNKNSVNASLWRIH